MLLLFKTVETRKTEKTFSFQTKSFENVFFSHCFELLLFTSIRINFMNPKKLVCVRQYKKHYGFRVTTEFLICNNFAIYYHAPRF